MIAVVDTAIADELNFQKHKSWKNLAFGTFSIKVKYVEIEEKQMQALLIAKEKQGAKFRQK